MDLKQKRRRFVAATGILSVGAILLWPGCASKEKSAEKIRPGSRIPEYRQATVRAEKAVEGVLASLATVSAQSKQCPPEVLTNFSAEVRRLQVESVQARARTEAMQARGDEYFNHWRETLARVEDPQMRALVEKERPALQQSFEKMKSLSREGRESFLPFMASLRSVRNSLEKDPGSLANESVQAAIKTAREKGQEVREHLMGMQRELDRMSALLTPAGKRNNSTGRPG